MGNPVIRFFSSLFPSLGWSRLHRNITTCETSPIAKQRKYWNASYRKRTENKNNNNNNNNGVFKNQ